MSDLKLLPPDQPTRFERLLLDAASNEAPSAAQRERVRQALGLPLPVVAAGPLAAVGSRALLLKASLTGLVVAGLVGGWLWSRSAGPLAPSAAVPVTAPVARAPEAVAPPVVSVVEVPAPTLYADSTSSAAVAESKVPAPRRAPALESGTDLSEQLRLIEAARSAIASGNAPAAATALTSYSTRFPRGSFAQEASVLRIQQLDLQGNRAQATAQSRSFLARHPNSPHVALVKRIADRAQ